MMGGALCGEDARLGGLERPRAAIGSWMIAGLSKRLLQGCVGYTGGSAGEAGDDLAVAGQCSELNLGTALSARFGGACLCHFELRGAKPELSMSSQEAAGSPAKAKATGKAAKEASPAKAP